MSGIIRYLTNSLQAREPGNIDLHNRKKVPVDGGFATVRSMSFNEDGREVLVPTAVGGKILSDDDAVKHYRATGGNI